MKEPEHKIELNVWMGTCRKCGQEQELHEPSFNKMIFNLSAGNVLTYNDCGNCGAEVRFKLVRVGK